MKSLYEHIVGGKHHAIILKHIDDAAAAETMHMAADKNAINNILHVFMSNPPPPGELFAMPPQATPLQQHWKDSAVEWREQQRQQPQAQHTPAYRPALNVLNT